jgi:ABC-type transport system involved in multi-copper enzyme maturation permease subunit
MISADIAGQIQVPVAARLPRLLGLRNVARKDVADWRHGRRALVIVAISAFWFVGTASAAWINNWVLQHLPAGPGETPPKALPMDPLSNLLMAAGSSFSLLVAVFVAMSLLLAERETGTLGWTASKPVSRTSILLSTWGVSSLALWIVSILVPLVATVVAVGLLYGVPSISAAAVLAVVLGMGTMFVLAVGLAASTVVPSQAGVAGIGLAVLFGPSLVTGMVPALTPYLPTSIVGWGLGLAAGQSVPLITPVAWGAGLVAVLWFARARFAAQDL